MQAKTIVNRYWGKKIHISETRLFQPGCWDFSNSSIHIADVLGRCWSSSLASSQERLKLLLSTLSQAAEPLAPLAGLYALRLGTRAEDENGRRLGAGAERRGFSLVWDLFCVAGGLTYHQQRIGRVFCRGPRFFSPTRQEGVVRFDVGIRVCDASTPRPHPVSRQSSSPVRQVSRQSSSPVDPAESELLASGSRPVSRQSCSPVDPAEYPTRAAHQWIPPSIPPERLTSGSRRVFR